MGENSRTVPFFFQKTCVNLSGTTDQQLQSFEKVEQFDKVNPKKKQNSRTELVREVINFIKVFQLIDEFKVSELKTM